MGFFSKAAKAVKKVVKKTTSPGRKLLSKLNAENKRLIRSPLHDALFPYKESLEQLNEGLNKEADPVPDYASAESRASIYERRKRRTGQASGRSSTIMGGSTLGSLAPTSSGSYARRKLLGGA